MFTVFVPCQDPPFPGHLEVVNGWMWKSIWNHDACRYFATSQIKILFWKYCRELAIPRLLDFLLYAEAHRILSRSRKPPSGTTSAFKDGNNWIDQLITENTSIIQVYYIYLFFLKWSIDAYGCLWYILNSKEHYDILFFLMLRRIQRFRIWTLSCQEDSSDPEIIEFVSQAGWSQGLDMSISDIIYVADCICFYI